VYKKNPQHNSPESHPAHQAKEEGKFIDLSRHEVVLSSHNLSPEQDRKKKKKKEEKKESNNN